MNGPSLTEPGITYFLSQTLKECRSYKDRNISLIFNLSMTTAFLLVFGVILLLKYILLWYYKQKGRYVMNIYFCKHCKRICYTYPVNSTLVCCGDEMTLLSPKTEDAGNEKHLPVVEKIAKNILSKPTDVSTT